MPLGRLYASLSVEKSESWGMMGLKGSRRVQSNIESARRKLSVKPASNVLPSHSVGIRIRKTITKQVVQRYLPIYGANLSIYEIENVDMGTGTSLNICDIVPSMIVHFVISDPMPSRGATVRGEDGCLSLPGSPRTPADRLHRAQDRWGPSTARQSDPCMAGSAYRGKADHTRQDQDGSRARASSP